MIQIHDLEQGTDAWHDLRSGKYTGSNADKLLAHATQVKIVDGVATKYALTEITGFGGNFYTRRGHILEDEALELYQAICGAKIARPGFVTNSAFPSCGYSPDGLCDDRTIECKAFNEAKHMKMLAGDIPLKVLAQCHFGMLICGKKLCDLLIYNPDLDAEVAFKIIPIKFNRDIANNFKRILAT